MLEEDDDEEIVVEYDFDRYLLRDEQCNKKPDPQVLYLTSLVEALKLTRSNEQPITIPQEANTLSRLQNLIPLVQQLSSNKNQKSFIHPSRRHQIENQLSSNKSQTSTRRNQIENELVQQVSLNKSQRSSRKPPIQNQVPIQKKERLHYYCACGNKWTNPNLDTKYVRRKCDTCGTKRVSLEAIGLDSSVVFIQNNQIVLKQ